MPAFQYRAVDLESQQALEGTLDATDERSARATLRMRGMLPLLVESRLEEAGPSPVLNALVEALTFRPVKPSDLVIFLQQLATLIDAGLPIVEIMVLLEEQTNQPTLRSAIVGIRKDILGGEMLSEAMGKHPRIFPGMLINLTAAGELSGSLPVMLNRLAEMLDKNLEIERKVKAALTYPALVCVTVFGVVLLMMLFVVPTFQGLYSKAGADLPLPTQVLLWLSDTLRASFGWLSLGAVFSMVAYRWYRQTPQGRPVVDRFWLKVPIIGPVLLAQGANSFTRAFGTVYGAGVPIVQALETCRKVVTNEAIGEVLDEAAEAVRTGSTLGSRLANTPYFPRLLAQMIAVGESSGKLEQMSGRAVAFSDKEIDYKIKQMTNMLEPLVTIVIGLVVMGIALSMYLPLFDLSSMVKH